MKTAIALLLSLSGCYTQLPGYQVTTQVVLSPCAGAYAVETDCLISVGPWPFGGIRREKCTRYIPADSVRRAGDP